VSDGATGRGLAVVGERRLARLRVEAGAAERLLDAARELELGVRDAALHGDAFVCLAPLLSVPDSSRVRGRLSSLGLPGFAWEEGLGAVSLVGVGGGEPGVLLRALRLGGSSLLGVTSGPLRVSLIVPETAVEEGERAFHREFVEQG
jgi:hypothetical protein